MTDSTTPAQSSESSHKNKTYVLAGYDWNGALKDTVDGYEKSDDYVVIHPKASESMEEAIKNAHIPSGSNVTIACHGTKEGQVVWAKDEEYHNEFSTVFRALPRTGIDIIEVNSCFGGGSIERDYALDKAPLGSVVLSATGSTVAYGGKVVSQRQLEKEKTDTVAERILEYLDAVDPAVFSAWTKESNAKLAKKDRVPTNPDKFLPHLIGIGGNPPIRIELNDEMKYISGHDSGRDEVAFNNAVKMTKEHFDTNLIGKSQGQAAEDALDKQIERVAQKMRSGQPITDLDEKRIGYGITTAYMELSGKLERDIALVTERAKDPHGSDKQSMMQDIREGEGLTPLRKMSLVGYIHEIGALNEERAAAPKAYHGEIPQIHTEQVAYLQQQLKHAGIYKGPLHGELTTETLKALDIVAKKAGITDLSELNFMEMSSKEVVAFETSLAEMVRKVNPAQASHYTPEAMHKDGMDLSVKIAVVSSCIQAELIPDISSAGVEDATLPKMLGQQVVLLKQALKDAGLYDGPLTPEKDQAFKEAFTTFATQSKPAGKPYNKDDIDFTNEDDKTEKATIKLLDDLEKKAKEHRGKEAPEQGKPTAAATTDFKTLLSSYGLSHESLGEAGVKGGIVADHHFKSAGTATGVSATNDGVGVA